MPTRFEGTTAASQPLLRAKVRFRPGPGAAVAQLAGVLARMLSAQATVVHALTCPDAAP